MADIIWIIFGGLVFLLKATQVLLYLYVTYSSTSSNDPSLTEIKKGIESLKNEKLKSHMFKVLNLSILLEKIFFGILISAVLLAIGAIIFSAAQ